MVVHPVKTKSMVIASRQKHQLKPLMLKYVDIDCRKLFFNGPLLARINYASTVWRNASEVHFLLLLLLLLLSTSLWGVYSETFIHHYNIPLAYSFTRLCMLLFFLHICILHYASSPWSPCAQFSFLVFVTTKHFRCRFRFFIHQVLQQGKCFESGKHTNISKQH